MSSSGATTVRGDHEPRSQTRGDSDLAPGESVSRYVTLGAIGRGANGVVYRAYDPELDRRVALKLFAGRGAKRAAVLREARALARLRHSNVVAVYDVGERDGTVFVAMELVEGRDFAAWLNAEPRDPAAIRRVLAEAGRGLIAAHDAGVIHCDFKPSNVMVADSGAVFVADFGLARHAAQRSRGGAAGGAAELLAAADDEAEAPELPPGTPAYLAPELYTGAEAGPRSDVYAFCVTAWEALLGARPWDSDDEFAMLAAKNGGPPSLPTAAAIDTGLAAVIRSGLAANPHDRPDGLQPILAALDPRPRTRRWPALLVGAGAASVLVYAVTRDAACDGAPARTASVWNDDARTTLAASVSGSGVAHADATAAQITTNVDRYVHRWHARHRDACEATHVHKEQSERLLDLRMRCLARKLDQLQTLLRLLGEAPEEIAGQGAQAVAKLDGQLRCGADDVDRDAQASASTHSAELDRIEVLEAVAQYDEALQLARSIADAPGGDGLWARYRVGRLLDRTGDPKSAVEALAAVHWEAEAAGFDEVAAKAGIYVIYEHAAVFNDTDAALAWAPHVEAAVARAGDHALDRAALIENVGVAHLYRPDTDQAEANFEEALTLREEAPGHNGLAVVSALGNLGIVYEETRRYDDAIAQHERALAILREQLGEHHPHTARVMDNLGTASLRKGDVATALEHFRAALQIRTSVHGPRHRTVGLSSAHLAAAALAQDDPDAAARYFERALDIYRDIFDPSARDVLLVHEGLAHTHAVRTDWPAAKRHAELALAGLGKALPADHPELVALREILAAAEQASSPARP